MEARNPAIPIIQSMASWNRPDNQTSFASSELVIPGQCEASNPESRDSPMCNCTSEVWSFGPSRNDGELLRRFSRLAMTVETGWRKWQKIQNWLESPQANACAETSAS